MSNKYLNTIINKEIINFIDTYSNWSPLLFKDGQNTLIHSGEYGLYREKLIREFLKNITPGQYKIGEGFIVNSKSSNSVSTQCDIIIYDDSFTPFTNDGYANFFPIETIVGIGEVKSDLSLTDLKEALVKLARNKELRDLNYTPTYIKRFPLGEYFETEITRYNKIIKEIEEKGSLSEKDTDRKNIATTRVKMYERIEKVSESYNTHLFHTDNIFSFLVCNKLKDVDFDTLIEQINSEYTLKGIKEKHRHNMILSLEDGIILYIDNLDSKSERKTYSPFPRKWDEKLKSCYVPSYKDNLSNIGKIVEDILKNYKLTNKNTDLDQEKPKIIKDLNEKLKKYLEENSEIEIKSDELDKIIKIVFTSIEDYIKTGRDFGKVIPKLSMDFANVIAIIGDIPPYFKDPLEHIKIFCHYIFLSLTDTTVLYPELSQYLEDIVFNKNTVVEK